MLKQKHFNTIVLLIIITLLYACATTSSIKPNNSVLPDDAKNAALVYFIRPEPLRTRGIADNDVRVEINGQLAVLLSAGEYVALKIKPGKTEITLRNQTFLTAKPMPVEVHRSAVLQLEAGKVYYIHTKFTQEEFRGIYFKPVELSAGEAKQLRSRLKPHGNLAKTHPI